jgi:hypothetical protein
MRDDVEMARSRWSVAPHFLVDSVVATANYYRDRLGLEYDRFWGEPASFCMVHRNGYRICFGQNIEQD